jgi:hypothetical protein
MDVRDLPGRRRDAGIRQVTERDILALTWIAEQYCLSFDQLQQLLAFYSPARTKNPDTLSVGATRNAVERWLQLGYIEQPRKIIRSYPVHIWLSRKGLRELALSYSYYQPNPTTVTHFYAVNEIRLRLQQYHLSAQWVSHRATEQATDIHPVPDAELQIQDASLVAIQVVERLTSPIMLREAYATLEALVHRRRANRYCYAHLWYFLHTDVLSSFSDRKKQMAREIQDRLVFSTLDAKEIALDYGVVRSTGLSTNESATLPEP